MSPPPDQTTFEDLPLSSKQRIDAVCRRFEQAWKAGPRPDLAPLLADAPEADRPVLLVELLAIELEFRRAAGERPAAAEYESRFPEHVAAVQSALGGPAQDTNNSALQTGPGVTTDGPPAVPGYELKHELGRGGMGMVYCARHSALNRVVALKFVLPSRQADAHQRGRFRQEAETIARLRHPNIVQIYDIGEVGGGCFLALEYADGGSLRERLTGTPLNAQLAARLMEPVVRAVMHAHRHGVIHRDIKPANVLLTVSGDSYNSENKPLPATYKRGETIAPVAQVALRDCTPKLTDFGLARVLDGDGPASPEPGVAAGTPAYMSPEQASGQGACTPAVDVWALGATLYEMLTGRPPFKGPTARETLRMVLWEEPVPLRKLNPAVPAALEEVCLRCLQKKPEERYPSARELAHDLQRYLSGPRRSRMPWVWVSVAAAGAAVAAYAGWRLMAG